MIDTLQNRVVIVTGASSGIGAATARLLSSLGCRLTLAARSTDRIEKLAQELGPDALAVPTDVTSGPDVANMVELTLSRFGRIDALLANAGIYIPGDFAAGDPDDFVNLIDVNVNGVLRCAHAVLPAMKRQGFGDIIVTSSISGVIDIHWEPVYSASKHAVQTFVHTLRRQVAADGIRVGSIGPGMVANELWGLTDERDVDRKVSERASLRSEDVAEAIAFMLSRPAHVTIRDLVILPQNQDL
ncbi:MAG: SDR family oxidoreductase [Spirochaetaceae bacterium]|nr:MAG: SDR family oxidoreductase [Spirochaetaceae bacterium]